MKIALIGTHRIGKTTVLYELAAELKKKGFNVGILEEVVRDCPLPVNEEATEASQKWIVFTQIARELALENTYDILLCDRSVLDDYAYYFNKFGKNEILEHVVKDHLKTYSFLFKLPFRTDLLNEDGFASVNKDFQRQIDQKLDFLLEKFNQKYFQYISIKNVLQRIY